jgi:2-desacetyl-2-hydroxyethyl bacteriochlorophyllide A dehydrogenase
MNMKSLVCVVPGQLEWQERSKPSCEKDSAILRITRIGICGTDLHAFEGTQPYFNYPRVLGHELAGEIVDIDGTHEFKKGELATFIPYWNCGSCAMCLQGKTNCCVQIRVFGVHIDGGMAEYLSVPSRLLLKSGNISENVTALIEPLAIGAHAIRRAEVDAKDQVVVVGAGPIGIGIVQFAKAKGANVVIIDVNDERLSFCTENFGIEKTINVSRENVMATLSEFTGGQMASVVFDATGNLHALQEGFKYMSHGSKYVLVGLQSGNISFSHPEFHKREGTLMSSRNATTEDFKKVIDTIAKGDINPLKMVTHHVKFKDVKEQFSHWLEPKNKVIKVLVEID